MTRQNHLRTSLSVKPTRANGGDRGISPATRIHVEKLLKFGGQPYGPSTKAGTRQMPFLDANSLRRPVNPVRPRIKNTTSFSALSSWPFSDRGMLAMVKGCASLGIPLTVGRMT